MISVAVDDVDAADVRHDPVDLDNPLLLAQDGSTVVAGCLRNARAVAT